MKNKKLKSITNHNFIWMLDNNKGFKLIMKLSNSNIIPKTGGIQ